MLALLAAVLAGVRAVVHVSVVMVPAAVLPTVVLGPVGGSVAASPVPTTTPGGRQVGGVTGPSLLERATGEAEPYPLPLFRPSAPGPTRGP